MSNRVLAISLLGIYDNSRDPRPLFADVNAARAAIAVSTLLSALAVLFRLYTRLVIIKKCGWDDVLLGVYMIFGMTLSILVFELTGRGWGMHMVEMTVTTVIEFRHVFYYAYGVYVVATSIIKLSLLFQYLRIPIPGKLYSWPIITTIAVVSIWGIGFSILAWYPCAQISSFWSANGIWGLDHCWFFASPYAEEVHEAYLSHSVTNMVLDLAVLALAAPLFWRKDTSAEAKRGLLALVAMGTFVTGLAILRVQSIVQHKTGTWPTLDPFFYTTNAIVLSVLEISCASVVASVPVFWPVLLRHISRIIVIQVTDEVRVETRNRESLLDDIAAADGGAGGGHVYNGGAGSWAQLTSATSVTSMRETNCPCCDPSRPSLSSDGGGETVKSWPAPPMPARTRTPTATGGPGGHRGFRNNSNGGNSVASHEVYMASTTNPLMAVVPSSPRWSSPGPPPVQEARMASRSNGSACPGRQQVYMQRGQALDSLASFDMGSSAHVSVEPVSIERRGPRPASDKENIETHGF
ncbi:hypothetical protein RB595_001826 [Gaeumannomyces hyphopodioides]